MPLHDWADDRAWHRVHPVWLTYLLEDIQERLPDGYKAFLGGVPSLTVDTGHGRPDVSVRRWDSLRPADSPTAGGFEPDVEAAVAVRLAPQPAIHVDRGGQLIAALELVSPRNKDRAGAKESYAARYLGYLQLGVHLMLVDVLPRPRGYSFADAIAAGVGLGAPPLPPPFAAAYRVGEAVPVGDEPGSLLGVWQRPLRPGDELPTLPLPLSVHQGVPVDLERAYTRATRRAYLD